MKPKPEHPWKAHANSLANLRPAPENLVPRGEIPVEKLRAAFKRSRMSKSELARRMGWEKRKPDISRVNRYLGMETLSNGQKREHLTYEVAVRLCHAMDADPFECGI